MRGEIMCAEIGLDLDDFADPLPAVGGVVDEELAQQLPGDGGGVAVVKLAREPLHGGRLAQFPV